MRKATSKDLDEVLVEQLREQIKKYGGPQNIVRFDGVDPDKIYLFDPKNVRIPPLSLGDKDTWKRHP